MLWKRHRHEWLMGRSCGRARLHDTAEFTKSHRLFNPAYRWRGYGLSALSFFCCPLSSLTCSLSYDLSWFLVLPFLLWPMAYCLWPICS